MLIPQVQKLVDDGEMSPHDAFWIKNLPNESQLAAALKCLIKAPNPVLMIPEPRMSQKVRQFQTGNGGHSSNKSRD